MTDNRSNLNHCVSHHIPIDVISVADMDEFSPEDNNEFLEEDGDLTTMNHRKALLYLQNRKVDLVKGDLIIFDAVAGYRNQGISIYNGTNIVSLSTDLSCYGCLPN